MVYLPIFMFQNQSENHSVDHSCSACVGDLMPVCRYCKHSCIKYGKTTIGKQRLFCKLCKRTMLAYMPKRMSSSIKTKIKILLKEGCGIRSISRILKISASTVIRRIKKIGSTVEPPVILSGRAFELDELCTFVGNKKCLIWITYAVSFP